MLNFDNIDFITPTEYSKYVYIGKILNGVLKGKVNNSCDIGCGTGNLLSVLANYKIPSKGIDISDSSLKIAKDKLALSHIELEKKDAYDLDEQFDLVYLSEVLEHIEDDNKLLEFIHRRVVKKEGYLIVTVPAHQHLYSAFDKNVGHHRRYDKKQLRTLLVDNGFKPIIFWSYGSIFFHLIANTPLFFDKSSKMDFKERTVASSIRNFPGISGLFVSRVNPIHHIFFILDYLLRNSDSGIEYCVLCESY